MSAATIVRRTRQRGYKAEWDPRPETRRLILQVQEIIAEYEQFLPMTIRQILYRLVGIHDYPKTGYTRLCEHLNTARRARWIPFSAIRDDGVLGGDPGHLSGVGSYWNLVRLLADQYTLDKQQTQSVAVEVLCEAGGMVPQLERVAHRFSVAVWSSGGFDSTTLKHSLAERIVERDKPTVVLHLGDYDKSGVDLYRALEEDVCAFVKADAPHLDVTFERVALTPEQIQEYNLPTTPAKNERQAREWIEKGIETCQLEALPPDVIAELLNSALLRWSEPTALSSALFQEDNDRRDLAEYVLPGEGGSE